MLGWIAVLLVLAFACEAHADASSSPAAFPLKVGAEGRLLVDQNDRPFLVQAEAAWGLIAAATFEHDPESEREGHPRFNARPPRARRRA
jgi:hypothetical protein